MLRRTYTIGLWVILIVLSVAFYQIFSGPPSGPAQVEARSESLSTFARLLPIAFLVLFAFFFAFLYRRQRGLHDGLRLLGQGRYLKALEQFESHRKLQVNPAATYNCGVARLQLWKIEAALVDFEAAKKLGAGRVQELVTLIPEHLALTHALLGRGDDARKALAELAPDKGDPGRVALVEAILFAREGAWTNARQRLAAPEVKRMSGTIGALARAIDALCIEQLTQDRRHIDRVALFGEASPDELARHWPELIAFVQRAPAW